MLIMRKELESYLNVLCYGYSWINAVVHLNCGYYFGGLTNKIQMWFAFSNIECFLECIIDVRERLGIETASLVMRVLFRFAFLGQLKELGAGKVKKKKKELP
ncbi:hypothetical protein NPIL_507181 [Nephila pilipes]|uniref:Uncharacterized protein n=1 Tax=Nephila pilipes TaxID=299642 RepID=A0A8X6QXN6_NEPPI|nr:hypothetical protein NPIL_507181 [Nephila pilipes]